MLRPRFTYRRSLAAAASVLIGLAGALPLTSPANAASATNAASAHHSEVSGVPYCDSEAGEWVVTWTVTSTAPPQAPAFRLVELVLTPPGTTVTGIAVTDSDTYPHRTVRDLVGQQRVPGTAESASLGVRAKWSDRFEEAELRWGSVSFDKTCGEPPEPEPEPGPVTVDHAATCDELIVTVDNPADGAPVEVAITTSNGHAEQASLAAGDAWVISFAASAGFTYEVFVDGDRIAEGGWQDPGDCEVEIEVPIAWRAECESLTIEVTNPLSDQPLEVTVRVGEQVEPLMIEPGGTAEVSFEAEPGTLATVTIGDQARELAWEQPEECTEPPAAPGEAGGLPVTGAQTGLVLGAALALLALGGGLHLVARRRRITFSA